MKFATLTLGLILSAQVFAADISGNARDIKISHVTVGRVTTESIEVACGTTTDSDLSCYRPTKFKNVVELTIDYTTNSSSENESFTQIFDVSDFSAQELESLKVRSATKRIQNANKIFNVQIKNERRQGSYQACGYETGCTAEELEVWTYNYDNMVKVVTAVRK